MSRPRMHIDEEILADLLLDNTKQKEIAVELGISLPTLARRIGDLKAKSGPLLQYRAIQHLQLTELQARVLEAITPEKIESASLDELVRAFKILKEKEVDPKGTDDVKGLVAYLIEIEKRQHALNQPTPPISVDANVIDVVDESERLPKL